MARILGRAAADGVPTTVTISVAFGCPFEGRVEPDAVLRLLEGLEGAGEVVLADTIGVATPSRVRSLVERTGATGFHGHNTRNTGYANALAAVEAGATVLDASVGGIGGCPFAPRATGNVATEDLVYLLEGEGVETGVDLDALVGVSDWLAGVLGRTLPGYVYRAGPVTTPDANSRSASAASSRPRRAPRRCARRDGAVVSGGAGVRRRPRPAARPRPGRALRDVVSAGAAPAPGSARRRHLADVVHGRGGHSGRGEPVEPGLDVFVGEAVRQEGDDLLAVRDALRIGREPLILGQAERTEERGEQPVVRRRDHQLAVAGGERLVRDDQRERRAVPPGVSPVAR